MRSRRHNTILLCVPYRTNQSGQTLDRRLASLPHLKVSFVTSLDAFSVQHAVRSFFAPSPAPQFGLFAPRNLLLTMADVAHDPRRCTSNHARTLFLQARRSRHLARPCTPVRASRKFPSCRKTPSCRFCRRSRMFLPQRVVDGSALASRAPRSANWMSTHLG